MKEYICKEEFREFFFSPESGTGEVISDLMENELIYSGKGFSDGSGYGCGYGYEDGYGSDYGSDDGCGDGE